MGMVKRLLLGIFNHCKRVSASLIDETYVQIGAERGMVMGSRREKAKLTRIFLEFR